MGFKQVILFDFWLNLIYTHSNKMKSFPLITGAENGG
jgi:hypothetical protein